MRKNNSKCAGQATMELVISLLAFTAVFLGMVFVIWLCLGNVETFLEAKGNADMSAAVATPADPGYGQEIADWSYTRYEGKYGETTLPFLGDDSYSTLSGNTLESVIQETEKEDYSAANKETDSAYGTYTFQPLGELPFYNANRNFAASGMLFASTAANLVQAKASNAVSITTLSGTGESRHTREKLQKSYKALIGVDTTNIDLDDMDANKVAMPKLQLLPATSAVDCN